MHLMKLVFTALSVPWLYTIQSSGRNISE